MALLDQVKVPADLRRLRREELRPLADELRERHIDVVAKKGGHFGASLGVVELTVALHYVYDTPRDQLVWDTGHQAYIHKMITGRNDRFETIRQRGGLVARDLNGDDYECVAIIGDGAMGCGLAYEALNNAGHTQRDFTVILNDNEMSIAPAVGALSKYLTRTITNPAYNKLREVVKDVLAKAPRSLGTVMEEVAGRLEDSVTNFLTPGMLFEALGFRYVGPVDGHDLDALVDTLSRVRKMSGPLLVHVLTRKGKGFNLAEADPWTWHAASPFDKITGGAPKPAKVSRPRYQKVFGTGLTELASENPKVVAITAAMPDGTSTNIFWDAHPDRYFDVGIAEGHGVTFAAGLATAGIRPYVAIYSTFLQRGYDSIVHDVALQDLPVVFCMDRAGIAGEDGPTHHGSFDIAYMLAVPGMTVTAPMNGTEMLGLMRTAATHLDGPFSIRWPRDVVPDDVPPMAQVEAVPFGTWEVLRRGQGLAILAVGTMVQRALDAAQLLARDGVQATVVNCRFLKPYDAVVLEELARRHTAFLTVEEGTVVNGFGSFMSREIALLMSGRAFGFESLGMPDVFPEHGGRDALLSDMGLDATGIAAVGGALAERMGVRGTARETA